MRFQDVFDNYLNSNQLTDVTAEKIPDIKESDVPMIYAIPDEAIIS